MREFGMSASTLGAIAIDGGDLPLGGGLLALIRPALNLLEPGGVIAVLSSSRQIREDLPAWCRVEHHEYLGCETDKAGGERHIIARGSLAVLRGEREAPIELPIRDGRLSLQDVMRRVPMPDRGDPSTGFAPRGAQIEPGGPVYPFSLVERVHVAPPEIGRLYDQAVSAQWDATV